MIDYKTRSVLFSFAECLPQGQAAKLSFKRFLSLAISFASLCGLCLHWFEPFWSCLSFAIMLLLASILLKL